MNVTATFLDASQLRYISTHTPFYYTPNVRLFAGLPDHLFALAVPVLSYWILSIFFHILDISEWKRLDKYRLHESEEVKARNLVTRTEVVRAVIFQQVIQTLMGLWWVEELPTGGEVDHVANMLRMASWLEWLATWVLGEEAGRQLLASRGADGLYTLYWWALPVARFFMGMFIIDTWQYFLHRAMHMNTYLYKKFHSTHHRLYVPYAFGALYNHPVEGFLLDTCGAVLAEWIAGSSTREAMLLFLVSTLKTVDDHCGYKLPWDPLQLASPNNADYHDIHHQVIGIKSNFSQPFFIHWDVILGTRMTRKDIEQRRAKQRKQKAL
ncbi:sphingosine hydroxylase [Daedaleopsis nitida]|nr:sphingosine hydroxylase [Daedaleopsis nitida]